MSVTPYNFKTTGDNLCKLRQDRGWTQKELAQKAKRSVSTVAALERGEHDMSVETFFALCHALECQPAELLGNQ